MQARSVVPGRERQGHHSGAEIGATDADVDNVGEGFAGLAARCATADRFAETRHLVEHTVHGVNQVARHG